MAATESIDVGENGACFATAEPSRLVPCRRRAPHHSSAWRRVAMSGQPSAVCPPRLSTCRPMIVDLLAPEGLHEGSSVLAAKQATSLEQRTDRQDIGGAHRSNCENDDRQCEATARRPVRPERKKVVGGPILRETGSHGGRSDQGTAPTADPTRIDTERSQPKRNDDRELRQRSMIQAPTPAAIVLHDLEVGRDDMAVEE